MNSLQPVPGGDEKLNPQDAAALDRSELAAALDGDEDALARLVRVLTPVIQGQVGRAVLGSGQRRNLASTTEDLTQEIFLALFRDDGRLLRRWDPEVASLEAYVSVIARRRAISLLRGRRHNPRLEEPTPVEDIDRSSPDAGPERTVASRDDLRWLVARCRRSLSPTGREIFEQLYVLERSVEEVRADMDLSANAIYQWRHRLKHLARQWLDERAGRLQPAERDEG